MRASEFRDISAGKRYPKLLLLLACLLVFLMIAWIPHHPTITKVHGPLAIVWPQNQTRDSSTWVRPNVNTELIKPQVCDPSIESSFPYILIVVCSAIQNFDRRMAIRSSWGNKDELGTGVGVVFLVGNVENTWNNTDLPQLQQEATTHNDILQEDFIDSYINLTIKSVILLKWFNTTCDLGKKRRVEYLMKTDDDMYINLPKLNSVVRDHRKPNLLMGSLICNAVPIKDPYNKYFVPTYMFDEKKYPNYLSGTGYIMHRETAKLLYTTALVTPLFHMEDVYLTGILTRKLGIKPQDNIGFSYLKRNIKNACLINQIVTAHQVTPEEMVKVHKSLKSNKIKKCPPLKAKALRSHGPNRCLWLKKYYSKGV